LLISIAVSTDTGRLEKVSSASGIECAGDTYCNIPCITIQNAAANVQVALIRSLPLLLPPRLLLLINKPVDGSGFRVDDDLVAILNQRNRSSSACLWDNVPDNESAAGSRKPSVGDECCGVGETCTSNGSGWSCMNGR